MNPRNGPCLVRKHPLCLALEREVVEGSPEGEITKRFFYGISDGFTAPDFAGSIVTRATDA